MRSWQGLTKQNRKEKRDFISEKFINVLWRRFPYHFKVLIPFCTQATNAFSNIKLISAI